MRKDLLKNIDIQINAYNDKLTELTQLKAKIGKATYDELKKYKYPTFSNGMVKFFNAWLGEDGKMHEESKNYCF